MNNPNGPYPGRQLFLGMTEEENPFFAYLVTGRSPESRERKAVLIDNVIRMGPLGDQPYDSLRHYAAVKYDNNSGIAAVSNGIQTEAVFETYKLIFNTASDPAKDYMEKILDGAGAEPDSYHTPRIAGIITKSFDKNGKHVFIIGIKGFNAPSKAYQVDLSPGKMVGISTYNGSLDNPESRNPAMNLPELEFKGTSPQELANLLFDISAASYKGNDIRVCSIGGILSEKSGWSLSIKNVHE
jgi:IMP cyclohydrolase